MAQSICVETTVVSYLTAWRSRDLIRAAQQQITRYWWDLRRSAFDLYTSELVLKEASEGDASAAKDRLHILLVIPKLNISERALDIADALLSAAALTAVAARDAQHVASVRQTEWIIF